MTCLILIHTYSAIITDYLLFYRATVDKIQRQAEIQCLISQKTVLKFVLEEAGWLLNEPESLSHLLENQSDSSFRGAERLKALLFLMWRINGPSAPHLLSVSSRTRVSRVKLRDLTAV